MKKCRQLTDDMTFDHETKSNVIAQLSRRLQLSNVVGKLVKIKHYNSCMSRDVILWSNDV